MIIGWISLTFMIIFAIATIVEGIIYRRRQLINTEISRSLKLIEEVAKRREKAVAQRRN